MSDYTLPLTLAPLPESLGFAKYIYKGSSYLRGSECSDSFRIYSEEQITAHGQQCAEAARAPLLQRIAELERLCDATYVAQGADAYNHAAELLEAWRLEQKDEGKPACPASLCDGLAWMFERIAEIERALAEKSGAEPVEWQYQDRDGVWRNFIDANHRDATIDSGAWPIRALYAAPTSQPVALPDAAMVERLAAWLRGNARMLMLATGDTTTWHRDYAKDILAAAFAAPEVPRG